MRMSGELERTEKAIGIIDLGSNSVRLLLVRVHADGSTTILNQVKHMVRLGEGGFTHNRLQEETMARTIAVLRGLAEMCAVYETTEIIAIATAAVRDAVNGPEFIRRVQEKTGIDFTVVSGREEARLIYLGVSSGLEHSKSLRLFIDIGGGTSEIACISLGGIVCSESINTAGDVFTNDIQSYVRQQHNIRIGERTAEAIKCSIGAAVSDLEEEPEDFVVTGPNMLTALPQTVSLSYSEIAYALEKSLTKIDAALMKVLESMPPELYADIVKNGIYLAGGGALIKGLDRRLGEKTGIPFHVAEDPLRAIARGTGIALKNINRFSFLMK